MSEARDRAILGALRQAIAKADAELQERARVRNVRGIMIARGLKEALEETAAAYAKDKRLVWPENVRRENEEALAAARAEAEAAAAEADRREAEFKAQALERFLAALPPSDRPADPEAAQTLFAKWAAGEWPPGRAPEPAPVPAPPTPGGETPAVATPGAPGDAPAPASDFFAQSEGAGAAGEWFVAGRFSAEMAGPELIRIAVLGRTANDQGRQFNPLSQQTTNWTYEHARTIPAETPHVFRLRRVEDAETVDVVAWPDPSRGGALSVRSRAGMRFPLRVAFELQAAPAGAAGAPASGAVSGAPGEPPPALVEVRVTSEPPGATIMVGDRIYREGATVAKTPCTIRIAPETHAVRVQLPGYADHVVPEFRAQYLRSLHARLTPERDLPGRRVKVNARQVWESPGELRINAGDRLVVVASGQWTIGAKGEATGPDGYDRKDPAFQHYYGASAPPRPVTEANYGALLVRIGFPGSVYAAGSEFGVTARQSGLVYFDVNESPTAELRKDNSGSLDVKVIIIPKDGRTTRGR